MAAHRYWRVEILATVSTSFPDPSFAEIGFCDTPGGATLTTGGTASAQFTFLGLAAADGVDGNTATLWGSTTEDQGQWFAYDFGMGVSHDIVEVYFTSRNDGSFYAQTPTRFYLSWSDDGTNWTRVWRHHGALNVFTGALQTVRFTRPTTFFPSSAHEWWSIYPLAAGAASGYSMAEIEYRATVSGADQATGGTATARESFGVGTAPPLAFDNNTGTLWGSFDKEANWIAYQFTSPVFVGEVAFTSRADVGFSNQTPHEFLVEYSDDGIDYLPAWFDSTTNDWTVTETRVFANPNPPDVHETGIGDLEFGGIELEGGADLTPVQSGSGAMEFAGVEIDAAGTDTPPDSLGQGAMEFGPHEEAGAATIPVAAGTGLRQFWTFGI